MTRTSLLQLLAHPTALTGADVRALEELAQAFPYCQSAHLLLAKAAHDQGSMLAPQRLRRAATYAADRARLRQLIEQQAAEPVAVAVEATETLAAQVTQPAGLPAAGLPTVQPAAEISVPEPAPAEAPLTLQEAVMLEDKPDQVIGTTEVAAELPAPQPQTQLEAGTELPVYQLEAQPTQELLVEAKPTEPTLAEAEATLAETPTAELPDAELPAQAPPIRPPAEAENARLEFGLAQAEPAELIAYRLPDLPEPAPAPAPVAATTPRLPPFSGVPDVCYAPGEGSRLGFCLVPAEDAGELLATSSLPPAGEFFAPDALLLDYLATHQPAQVPKPSSLELINSFLQRAPIASRRRAMPTPAMPDADPQADLSVRSTRAEHDLASENLAHILARQGKNERAIAVYERLMVKHPEKMAYFAAQIESLRPLA